MRATFQNSGQVLSIGLFFTLLVLGLAGTMPGQLEAGFAAHGVTPVAAHAAAAAPPVAALFAAFLGYDPVHALLGTAGTTGLTTTQQAALSAHSFFPNLIAPAFMHGIALVFALAALLCVVAAIASWLRGGRYVADEIAPPAVSPAHGRGLHEAALLAPSAIKLADPWD